MSGFSSRLSHSAYLSNLADRFGLPDEATAKSAVKALLSADASDVPQLKARFNLGWAYLALSTETHFETLGRLQSAFADAAIDVALDEAWTAEKLIGRPRGLFILGLGKLGGHDLNFSSDIDLIAYYDPEQFPVSKSKGQAYIADRLMKRVTRLLTPPGKPDFVYRVDWRLRPEASVSGLAMSTSRAQDFYFFRALPWHRLALLKARVVAGDMALGQTFLKELTPFLWRQNLDFRAIDELAELKRRINLEHPRLKTERLASTPIGERPLGFNVKLGAGGIREIEFIANAQQMIWGGKHYELRKTNTLKVLDSLVTAELMQSEDRDRLKEAYIDHRRLENALQMLSNGHEHVLPDDVESWSSLLGLMSKDSETYFREVTTHRHAVHERFEATFETENPFDGEIAIPDLQPNMQQIITDWQSGFRRYGVRPSRRDRLKPLTPALLKRIALADEPDRAMARIDRFLGNLSRSEQYLSLLAANPALLDALIDPLLYSPHMATLLEQSPHIIDTFLTPLPATTEFVLSDPDYGTRLERLRRYVNEGLYQNYHAFLTGRMDWRTLAKSLTDQAERTIDTALTIAKDDLDARNISVAVLGLGKLGQGLMAPQSDLDLVFLFDDDVDRELATKIVRRLNTILTTPLREGIAYELDMRLRPSGRSGPPAVTLSAFAQHHHTRARNWEHIALVSARVVAGDAALGAKVEAELEAILRRPRNQEQLFADAHAMWDKIVDERIRVVPTDRFGTKLRDGGLMMADFWDAVAALSGGERLTAEREGWTEILYWERLLGLTDAPLDAVPDIYADRLHASLADRQADLETRTRASHDHAPRASTIEPFLPIQW